MTGLLSIDAACAGMVLGAAVTGTNGNTLLAQGSVLTDSLLASLRQRGITHIQITHSQITQGQIDGASPDGGPAIAEKPTEATITARIAFIFRHTNGPASAQLQVAILAQAHRADR